MKESTSLYTLTGVCLGAGAAFGIVANVSESDAARYSAAAEAWSDEDTSIYGNYGEVYTREARFNSDFAEHADYGGVVFLIMGGVVGTIAGRQRRDETRATSLETD